MMRQRKEFQLNEKASWIYSPYSKEMKELREEWKEQLQKEKSKLKRYEFTKRYEECSGCGKRLDIRQEYARRYGFCDEDCGMKTYGLSWSDFY